jgi:diadenosine tetraphosphate (Ap4A) HIT family hydrolase
MPVISERVALANQGKYPHVIHRMASGWAVMGETQVLPGYCLLLPDPVVPTLNHLSGPARAAYLNDMVTLGDVVLKVTGAVRINYEMLGNLEPELHAHLVPRYTTEAPELRTKPIWLYDWSKAPPYSDEQHGHLKAQMAALLAAA